VTTVFIGAVTKVFLIAGCITLGPAVLALFIKEKPTTTAVTAQKALEGATRG
jgi:hypothetical protein